MKKSAIQFCGVLYDVRTKRDGGGRLQIDFGADALEAVLELQRLNAYGDTNLAFAIVPFHGDTQTGRTRDFIPDENGEIPL